LFVFRHKPSGRRIGLNYKVLFSFAEEHPDLEQVGGESCDYLLWRDPLARTVSLFFDKCRNSIDPKSVQEVQAVLLAQFSLSRVGDLRSVTFSQVVNALPRIVQREDHLFPQLQGVDLSKIGRVVDIASGLRRIEAETGLKFARRANTSRHGRVVKYYTDETRRIVETVYAADYVARPDVGLYGRCKRLMGFL